MSAYDGWFKWFRVPGGLTHLLPRAARVDYYCGGIVRSTHVGLEGIPPRIGRCQACQRHWDKMDGYRR